MRESSGLYSRAVQYIKEHYNQDITRQSVRERALKDEAQLLDIREEVKDKAEGTLMDLMENSDQDQVRFRSSTYVLDRLAKERGYGETVDVTSGGEQLKPVDITQIIKNFINAGNPQTDPSV